MQPDAMAAPETAYGGRRNECHDKPAALRTEVQGAFVELRSTGYRPVSSETTTRLPCGDAGVTHRLGQEERAMIKTSTAIMEREGDGYVPPCRELDISSQGGTVNETCSNLEEALELSFEAGLPHGTRKAAVHQKSISLN